MDQIQPNVLNVSPDITLHLQKPAVCLALQPANPVEAMLTHAQVANQLSCSVEGLVTNALLIARNVSLLTLVQYATQDFSVTVKGTALAVQIIATLVLIDGIAANAVKATKSSKLMKILFV